MVISSIYSMEEASDGEHSGVIIYWSKTIYCLSGISFCEESPERDRRFDEGIAHRYWCKLHLLAELLGCLLPRGCDTESFLDIHAHTHTYGFINGFVRSCELESVAFALLVLSTARHLSLHHAAVEKLVTAAKSEQTERERERYRYTCVQHVRTFVHSYVLKFLH